MAEGKALVFIDASVWIAAAGSTTGGSSPVLTVCQGKRFAPACSQRVLLEAQRNIRAKLGPDCLARFYTLLAALLPYLAWLSPFSQARKPLTRALSGQRTPMFLASVVSTGVAFLITLDRRHLAHRRVQGAGFPFQVLTPGEFLGLLAQGAGP